MRFDFCECLLNKRATGLKTFIDLKFGKHAM